VDKIGIEQLRLLVVAQAGDAFTLYISAIDQATGDLKAAEAKAAKQTQLAFEILIALAVVVGTPLTASAAAALAGPALQAKIATTLATQADRILTTAGVKNTVPITNAILETATKDSVIRLAKSYSTSDAQRITGEAIKSFSKTVSVGGHDDVDACALDYVKQIKIAATASKTVLNGVVAGATNFSQLLQVYFSFLPENTGKYYEGLTKQIALFKTNVAPMIVKKARLKAEGNLDENDPDRLYAGENVVKMNAFGRMRFARIDFSPARSPSHQSHAKLSFCGLDTSRGRGRGEGLETAGA